MLVYRVELERLDHGYEARVPEIHGILCKGLTEGETLNRMRLKLNLHHADTATSPVKAAIRMEVFRT